MKASTRKAVTKAAAALDKVESILDDAVNEDGLSAEEKCQIREVLGMVIKARQEAQLMVNPLPPSPYPSESAALHAAIMAR